MGLPTSGCVEFFSIAMLAFAGDSVEIRIEPDPTPVVLPFRQADPRLTESTGPSEPSARLKQTELVDKLSLQAAIRQARQHINQEEFAKATALLEPLVDRANGLETFLETLESAYRGEITKALSEQRVADAKAVAARLRAMRPDNPADLAKTPAEPPRTPQGSPAPAVERMTPAAAVSSALASQPTGKIRVDNVVGDLLKNLTPKPTARPAGVEARGKIDTLATESGSASADQKAEDLENKLRHARRLFDQKRYADALVHYEKAYEIDPVGVQSARDRWGYCLLVVSVDKYNRCLEASNVPDEQWSRLEEDVRLAKQLGSNLPALQYADTVLAEISHRRQSLRQMSNVVPAVAQAVAAEPEIQPVAAVIPAVKGSAGFQGRSTNPEVLATVGNPSARPTVRSYPVHHHPGQANGWQVLESDNFRVHHRDRRLADEIAQLAEQARANSSAFWFPKEQESRWTPKCDLYLYPTSDEYARATGAGPLSPGQTQVQNHFGRVLSRRVMLRMDDPSIKDAVLPHEITHVVLAGKFGVHTLPPWADEGMAVLTEPRSKQDAHLNNLAQFHRSGARFACSQLLTMGQYPQGDQRMRAFYAGSVGMCRYLVEIGGGDRLIQFLRIALDTNNYERALQQVYGVRSFQDLETGYNQFVAQLANPSTEVATSTR